MDDGWRNRFMAPVYALVISFVLVVILGYALDDPTQIQFTIPEQSGSKEQAEKLSDLRVRVETTVGNRTLDEGSPNQSGEFTLLNPHESIRICTTLPQGWFSARAVPGANGESCWVSGTPDKDFVITLGRRG